MKELVTTWFGTFLISKEETVSKLFPKEPEAIASRLSKMRDRKLLSEERELMKGLTDFSVHESRLETLGGSRSMTEFPYIDPKEYGYDLSLLQKAHIILAEQETYGDRGEDRTIISLIRAREEIRDVRDSVLERTKNWVEDIYPGLSDATGFLLAVSEGREEEHGKSYGLEVAHFRNATPSELERLHELSNLCIKLTREMETLDRSVADAMKKTCPNLNAIAGPVLGARLIELSGGLEKLAKSSSSKLQLLGAEKALFRHKKRGAKPPKHGVILQHPYVHTCGKKSRGKASRMLANKLVLAARADAYTKRDISRELLESLGMENQ